MLHIVYLYQHAQDMDKRSISLGGTTGWIRNNLEVFKHQAVLTSHDWFLLVQSAGDYLLYDMFPADNRKEACLLGLKNACSSCISATSAFDSENREVIDKVKETVVEALCVAEALFPKTEMAVMFHVLMHIPDGIYRWNNVRNFWSFFGERCMGWLIRFIHNRDLAVENIVTAYTRQSLVLAACGWDGGAQQMFEQLKIAGLAPPARSLLQPATVIMENKGALPGAFLLQVKRSRRNSRDLDVEPEIIAKIKACCRVMDIRPPSVNIGVRLEAGVKMNGRPVVRGDICVYTKAVPRQSSVDAGHAREVCTVLAFYQVLCGDVEQMFVEVIPIETHSRHLSLFIVKRAGITLTGVPSVFIHSDAILLALHVCPHFYDDTLVCAVPMWETR